jgi:ribonuclease T1
MRRSVLVLLIALLAAAPAWARQPPDRFNRIDVVALSELPQEARHTLRLIKGGGPFPYRQDGRTFQNRERRLPPRPYGYYREYTVPTPGSRDRGGRRIIAVQGSGRDARSSGEYYYTGDHYRSFRRIIE